MKKLILSLALMLACTACIAQNSAFKAFTGHFGKATAFAYANISNRQVLLVSHEVFGDDEAEGLQAIAATIFALDSDGKITCLGSIRSQGTNYPVSVADGKLMVAGHRFVSVYGIRAGEQPDLEIVSHEEGDCDSPKLKAMFETFEKATPVKFNPNCSLDFN